jgi:mRNA-degrading endonuclease RelE of RelBE toxin-antitoxin system
VSRKNHPDDQNRPPLPEGYRYGKHGKIISPRERLANIRNALLGDEQERFEKAFEEEWDKLPEKERDAISRRVDAMIRSAIEQSSAKPSILPKDSSVRGQKPENERSWAKEATEKRSGPRGGRQPD